MKWMTVGVALFLAGAAVSVPYAAKAQTPYHDVALPEERGVADEVIGVLNDIMSNSDGMVPPAATAAIRSRLDDILAQLPRPTRLRGMVQMIRSTILTAQRDTAAATRAIEESIQLLPDDPRPKLTAVGHFTFSGAAPRAADLLLAAADQAPELTVRYPEYQLDALIGRLVDAGKRDRADQLHVKLAEIGYVWTTAEGRSDAARAIVRRAVADGKLDLAKRHLSGIGSMDELAVLYVDREYEPLWEAIADWAESDLSRQHKLHLEALRRDWQATENLTAATAYARALVDANAYQEVVDLFLPVLNAAKSPDEDIAFLTPSVARSLIQLDRPFDAIGLMERLRAGMTGPEHQLARLNINANLIAVYRDGGRHDDAIATGREWLATVKPMGPEINLSAIHGVEAAIACAELIQDPAADVVGSVKRLESVRTAIPGPAFELHACRRDEPAAKSLVLTSLGNELTRGWALKGLQPSTHRSASEAERRVADMWRTLSADAEVRARAQTVGRILPAPVGETLPEGFDPLAPADAAPVDPMATT